MITLTREEAQQVLELITNAYVNSQLAETLRARLSTPEPEPVAWKGLTSTERKVLWLTSNNPAEFGEFIEAKLREKNERRAV
jgi:hypothetical protein